MLGSPDSAINSSKGSENHKSVHSPASGQTDDKKESESEEEEGQDTDDEGTAVDLVAVAKYTYKATEEDELSFKKGDRIR